MKAAAWRLAVASRSLTSQSMSIGAREVARTTKPTMPDVKLNGTTSQAWNYDWLGTYVTQQEVK